MSLRLKILFLLITFTILPLVAVGLFSFQKIFASVGTLAMSLLVIIVLSAIIVIATLWVISQIIIRPIIELTAIASRIQNGDFSVQATIRSKDEIGMLGRMINAMATKLGELHGALEQKITDQMRDSEKRSTELAKSEATALNMLGDLKWKQKDLMEINVKNQAVLESIGDGLMVTDIEGRITLVNNAFMKIMNFDKSKVLGKFVTEMIAATDEHGKVISESDRPINKVLKENVKITTIVNYQRQDGTSFPAAVTISPILLGEKVIGVVEVFRDITHEREIDKAKTEFVSLASHQLRTPLSTVNWYTEMLLSGDAGALKKEQKNYLKEVYAGNQRMVELVNALLNVSRLEIGTFIVEPEPTDVVKLATTAIKEQKSQIDRKKIHCSTHFATDTPLMQADPKLLRMVFQNLLSNSIKYTPSKGVIDVSISWKPSEGILIKVSDTGCGIPKNQQGKIFNKLFRADNAREKDSDGTGLGLYIVKSIVEKSGGKIWFESPADFHPTTDDRREPGTTFYISFPKEGMKGHEGERELI